MNEFTAGSTDKPLHPILVPIVDTLDTARATLLETLEAVPAEQRTARPADGSWTVAQIVDHLVKTERSCGRLFSGSLKRALEAGALPPEHNEDGMAIVTRFNRFAMADPARRAVAPEFVAASDAPSYDDAVAELISGRQQLLAAVRKYSGLALGTVSAPHPLLGSLTMYEWLLMVARHEERHVEQIRRLLPQLSPP